MEELKTCTYIRMDACKFLLVCLAVLAINARESTALILKSGRCNCYPSNKDGIHIANSANNIDNGGGAANIAQNQHISDTTLNRNPILIGTKPESVNYLSSGIELGPQHYNVGRGTSYYDPSVEDEIYDYYKQDPNEIDMIDLNTDFRNIDLALDEDPADLLDKASIGNINVVGNNNQMPNYLNDNTNYIHHESPHSATIVGTGGIPTFAPANVLSKPADGYNVLDNTIVSQGSVPSIIKSIPNLLTGNINVKPSKLNLKLSNNPIIDNWLFDEIKNIGISGPGVASLQTVDFQNVKIHLLNVLERNHYYISENGDLLDVNGQRLKMSNLKLQRVMISDPAAHIQLLAGLNCITASDTPYLEAVFVSLVYPPKILGLIPLKTISLPRCNGGGCSGQKCGLSPNNKLITYNTKKPILLHLSNSRSGESDELLTTDPQVDSDVQNISILPKLSDIDHGVSDGDIGGEGDDISHSRDDNDDGLGIRIIGGHAATSSGTPVSSKGRSGPTKG